MAFDDRIADAQIADQASDGGSGTAAAESQRQSGVILSVDPSGTVTLPAGVSLDSVRADGADLLITASDGTVYVVPGGAIIVPQIAVEGLIIPPFNVAALLIGNEPQPAAGNPQSSGGNFFVDPGDIQGAYGLGDLLPYTELGRNVETREEIIPQPIDRDPEVLVFTPNQPAGAVSASAEVSEAGLPARGNEPAGSNSASNSETTTGSIVFQAPDGLASVSLNGVPITAVGQTYSTPLGILTITSIAPGNIGYSYTLTDNTTNPAAQDLFTVTVTEIDGDVATATLRIEIIDDNPAAANDSNIIAPGLYGPVSGNVMVNDVQGADGATVTAVAVGNGAFAALGTAATVINGQYGVLTINPNGAYVYTRNAGTPGGVNDIFNYRLTDGDGDTASATLTISIGDSPATVISVPNTGAGTVVDEDGLPPRTGEAPGTEAGTDSEITSGEITFAAPDGVATVEINGTVVTGPGQEIVIGSGVLTIISYDPVNGVIEYFYTLKDNTSGDSTSVTVTVTVTDTDGDSDSKPFTIEIIDDAPLANDDFANQTAENDSVTVNVFANDIQGADSVAVSTVTYVPGSLSGSGQLVNNGDGTFIYTPGPGEQGDVTFSYTITDGDGDSDQALVTITLLRDSTPTLSVSGDDSVEENALPARTGEPAGSNPTSDAETASGTIAYSTGGDTLGSLVINGVNVTNGGTVTTTKGVLTISVSGAGYNYSYTLIDNTLSDPDSDTFSIILTDSDGDAVSTSLVIAIIDDRPAASDDAGLVPAGQYGPIGGNVLANDVQGADGASISVYSGTGGSGATGDVVAGTYGTLTIAADGTYSYTRNPGTKGGVQDVFTYTIVDGDGDPAGAQLVITIADSGTTLNLPVAGGAGTQVDEAGLPAGTESATDAEFASGMFEFTAPDGPAIVTINGVTAQIGQTISGNFGTLTVDNVDEGKIFYTYQLTTNTIGDNTFDSLLVRIEDQDGDFTEGNLIISIVDDVPTASPDGPYGVVEDGVSMVSGNVLTNDASGADTPKAFTSWAAGNAAEIAELNIYGTLVLNGDGTWSYTLDNTRAATQALTAADLKSYTLDYTMEDADGDTSPAVLTITITGAADGASVTTASLNGPDATVYEAGLVPNGSSQGNGSDATTGTFTVSATDGISTVTIGGTVFTLAQVQAFAATQGVVDTGEGTLRLTNYSGTATGGTISYSYTLKATIDNDSKTGATDTEFDDSVTIEVDGIGGTNASDTLMVRIVDDVPTASPDGPYGVVEDGVSMVSGNVLTNDASGADTPKAFTSWAAGNAAEIAELNIYGTLVLNGDGTWSYTLDNTRAATQALGAGFFKSYTLDYTMEDADGDTSPAVLTITITGAADGASVTTASLNGPDATVYEAGLVPNGSSQGNGSDATTGTFTVSATDGISTVTIGGTVFTLAQVQAFAATQGVVDTGEGTLRLTNYSGTATGGTISYSYTLKATIDNDSKTGATDTEFDDSVTIEVDGIGGTNASDTLMVRIVDDVPTASPDGPYGVVEDGVSMVSGNVLTNDASGADTPKAFTSWAAGNAAEIAELNIYGTLVLNGDGTWSYTLDNTRAATQALGAGFFKSYTLDYTMEDADGDTSPAVLTITITGAADGASVTTASLNGPDATVYEAGLVPNGSSQGNGSDATTGTFTVSATDGISTVTIGGTVFTLAQVQAFAATQGVVDTGEGTLRLTNYSGTATGGTISYSYTLKATIDNDSKTGATDTEFDDSVTIEVDGIGGTNASDTLMVRIVDDVPTASPDGPYGVVEDGVSMVSGNVLTNDASGADTPKAFTSWAAGNAAEIAELNIYGTLVLNGDGTWSYTLDNTRAATQALGAGFFKSYTLDYTMEDADGDTSPAVLTITITGAADGASVTTASLNGPDATVYEAGLVPNGSSQGNGSDATTGTFTVSATDGISTVTIGGTVFTLAQVQAFAATQGVVDTGEGTLRLTNYSGTATGGTISYSYTLKATIDNDSKTGATDTEFDDSVTIEVDGIGGTNASDTLMVRIVDDVPTASPDGPYGVVEDGVSMVSGNVLTNDASGADTPKAFTSWAAGNAAEIAELNIYGTLVLNGDGTWSYTLDNTRAATQALGAGFFKSYTLDYTMEDADGDTSPAVLTITITGAADGASVTTASLNGPDATVYEAGLVPNGSSQGNGSDATTGTFTVSATDGISTVTIGGTVFTLAQVQAFAATQGVVDTGEGTLRLTNYSGTATGGTISYSYTLKATIDNDSKTGATDTEFDDSVTIEVDGIGGTNASDTLMVRIVDDVPTASPDGPYGVVEDGVSMVSGNVLTNDASGADTPKAFTSWAAGNAAEIAELNIYGTLVLNGDGTWSYTLDNTRAATQALTAADLKSYTLDYTMEDADGDTSPAVLTITITGANDAPVVTDNHVWMSSDPAQQTPGYTNGYALNPFIPTDVDGDSLTVTASGTIPTGVYYFNGANYVAVTAGTVLYTSGGVNYLDDLVYRPTATTNDTQNLTLNLSVTDGTTSVTQHIYIHEVPPTRLAGQSQQIGDGSNPLTSGNDQTAQLVLNSEFATGLQDPNNLAIAQLTLYTDFQKAPFNVPIPPGERDTGAAADAREGTVTATIVINGITFIAVAENNGVQDWFYDPATGLEKAVIDYSDIRQQGNPAVSLESYLTANPPQAGNVWTLVYLDSDGGSYQARFVSFQFAFDDAGNPAITVDGDNTLSDTIYGTSGNDKLDGNGGDDFIFGRGGNDTITGGTGNDYIDGGTGTDTVTDAEAGDTIINVPPLVVDLGGDGMDFVARSAGIAYDYDGDGVAETTAWVGASDGILAFDANGNGTVDGASEFVFGGGDATDLDGLKALADSNGDGVLDARDAAFAQLGVWQDTNQNGIADAGEFRSLVDLAIVSIDLSSDGKAYFDAAAGVTVAGTATFTRADGSTGSIADAAFATGAARETGRTTQALSTVNAVAAAFLLTDAETQPWISDESLSWKDAEFSSDPSQASSHRTLPVEVERVDFGTIELLAGNEDARGPDSPSSQHFGRVAAEAVPADSLELNDHRVEVSASDSAESQSPVPIAQMSQSIVEAAAVSGMEELLSLSTQVPDLPDNVTTTQQLPQLAAVFEDLAAGRQVDTVIDHFAAPVEIAAGVEGKAFAFEAGIVGLDVMSDHALLINPIDLASDQAALAAA